MVAFEFANTVANSTGVQGDECKNYTTRIWKRLKRLNPYHHATPCENLPKFHIWHGQFGVWAILTKIQEKKEGLICKMTMLQFLKGQMQKMHLTTLISGSKHPKNIYNMSLLEKELKIQIKFEFKFNLEIKQKKK